MNAQRVRAAESLQSCPLFDRLFHDSWYLDQYADAVRALEHSTWMTARDHYLAEGVWDGRQATPFFDAEWYLSTYDDVPIEGGVAPYFAALEHYLTTGCREGRNPVPIFDEVWYRSRHPNVSDGYINGYHQFLAQGAASGVGPSPLFDEQWYRKEYPDVSAGIAQGLVLSGYHDYMRRLPAAERNPVPYFDVAWYRQTYPVQEKRTRLAYFDFLTSGAPGGYSPAIHFDESWYLAAHPSAYRAVRERKYRSGYHHFLYQGAVENLAPSPYFLPQWYATWYPEVREALARNDYAHPLAHYLSEGVAHGLSPNPYFDETWYLHNHPDIRKACEKGLVSSGHAHYVQRGAREQRSPSPVFEPDWYQETYPDVQEYIRSGLASSSYDHFCRYGRLVGRNPNHEFDEQWYVEQHPDVRKEVKSGRWVDGLHHFVVEGLLRGYKPKAEVQEQRREQNVAVTACARLELLDFFKRRKHVLCRTSGHPLVSIILVLYNRAELTLRCLRSVVHWADVAHEIIVVDNDSRDRTAEMLDRVRGIRVIRNTSNLHFLRAANQGADAARGDYLLFLNNDSELQVGALSSAAGVLQSGPEVGAVGAKVILNSGVLQEAGSYLLPNGFSAQFGRGQQPFASEFMHRRDVPYCSGAFLMTPRKLFLDSGAFDEAFLPAYYEDVDYCLRLWSQNRRVVFNPGSIILHHETGSSRYRRFLYPSVLRNMSILRNRYREYLRDMPEYPAAPISSLDGKRFRQAYLIIVQNVAGAMKERKVREIVAAILSRKGFASLYPLQMWDGDRTALENIPDEVEVVAGKDVNDLEDFCNSRKNVYAGVVSLLETAAATATLRRARVALCAPVFSATGEYPEFD